MIVEVEFIRPGKGTTVYQEQLVANTSNVKILLLENHNAKEVYQNDQLVLGANAPIVWFVFPGEWYEIGRFHTTDETFTGWYTNICTPFQIHGTKFSTTDLFLDFWQPATGHGVWLDESELDQAVAEETITDGAYERVQQTKEAIATADAANNWPPPITREFDLTRARELIRGGTIPVSDDLG